MSTYNSLITAINSFEDEAAYLALVAQDAARCTLETGWYTFYKTRRDAVDALISAYPPAITNDRSQCVSAGNLFNTEINDFTATVNQDRTDQLNKWIRERDDLDRWLDYIINPC